MTDTQFESLMNALKEINDNIKIITAYNAGKDNFNLSDLHSAIGNVASEISSIKNS